MPDRYRCHASAMTGGPSARPLFDDPSARALSRVGVVDVGSNSVRMVVFDGAARSPAYFYNEKIMCGLGKGLAETGRLNPRGRERALAALRRFALLAEGMDIAPLTVVATAAMREAEDGPEFQAEVLRETGLRLWVIDGDEEARLSAQGVLLGWPDAQGHRLRHRRQLDGTGADRRRQGRQRARPRRWGRSGCSRSRAAPKARRAHIDTHPEAEHEEAEFRQASRALSGRRVVAGDRAAGHGAAELSADRAARIPHDAAADPATRSTGSRPATCRCCAARTGTSPERMELVPLACEVLRGLIEVLKPSRDRRLGLWHPRGAAVRTDARPAARPRSADRGGADGRS